MFDDEKRLPRGRLVAHGVNDRFKVGTKFEIEFIYKDRKSVVTQREIGSDTLDFTSVDTAYSTISSGQASGLIGNQEACNGAYFVGTSPETSLIMAVLDEDIRAGFSLDGNPGCDGDAISDMTLKVGYAPSDAFLALRDRLSERLSGDGTAFAATDDVDIDREGNIISREQISMREAR